MLETDWFVWILIGVLGLFGIGLTYFVVIGVRAIYRAAAQTATEAGHRRGSAAVRAVIRMTVWALFFGAYYLFVYVLGRRLGWQAAIPAAVGLAAMVWTLLQADRLLTIRPGRRSPTARDRGYDRRRARGVRLRNLAGRLGRLQHGGAMIRASF